MTDTDALRLAIEAGGLAICLMGLAFGLVQAGIARPYRYLALLFGAFAVADLHETVRVMGALMPPGADAAVQVVSTASAFLIAPAFLFYVRAMAGLPEDASAGARAAHALPAAAAAALAALMPADAGGVGIWIEAVARHGAEDGGRGWARAALAWAFHAQCLGYLACIVRLQLAHRARLRELFASTDADETRWIVGTAALLGTHQALGLTALAFGGTAAAPPLVGAAFEVAIAATLALMGFRQSPGLVAPPLPAPEPAPEPAPKYAKSALDPARAARIAQKLDEAMARGRLSADPNLSLVTLAAQVGVSTNYVSQALNAHLGRSFFDYVNAWRVEAAKPLLLGGAQTVEEIAYEVGFNARSSFYTAFKKNTGQTPKAFAAAARRTADVSAASA